MKLIILAGSNPLNSGSVIFDSTFVPGMRKDEGSFRKTFNLYVDRENQIELSSNELLLLYTMLKFKFEGK